MTREPVELERESATRSSALPAIHGRLLDVETGRPLAGVTIRLSHRARVELSGVTHGDAPDAFSYTVGFVAVEDDSPTQSANLGRVNEIRADPRPVTLDVRRADPRAGRIEILGETVTDSDGRFELACPDAEDAQLTLAPPPSHRMEPMQHEAGRSSQACAAAFEWNVRVTQRE